MTGQALAQLSEFEARSLTEQVKQDAAALWAKLLDLYEGGAHFALGYPSWGSYYEAEFGQTKSHGYRLLDAARVVDAVPQLGNAPEAVVREFAPLKDEPEKARDTWAEVVDIHGEQPTAANVREVVEERQQHDAEVVPAPPVPAPAPGRGMGVHYSSATDEWATPQDLFDKLNGEFGFELDVCALDSSAKCDRYFTPENDGLAHDWRGVCWMNPPYGDEIPKWIRKAYESARAGATVVCLVPARVDTGWWWDYCRFGEVRFLRGRLKFGNAGSGAPFPSAVVVFGVEPAVKWWER